jgi:hypothetical protein
MSELESRSLRRQAKSGVRTMGELRGCRDIHRFSEYDLRMVYSLDSAMPGRLIRYHPARMCSGYFGYPAHTASLRFPCQRHGLERRRLFFISTGLLPQHKRSRSNGCDGNLDRMSSASDRDGLHHSYRMVNFTPFAAFQVS